jgi:hypothetical protein
LTTRAGIFNLLWNYIFGDIPPPPTAFCPRKGGVSPNLLHTCRGVIKMFGNLEFSINLYTEGEKFFDMLKAVIRDSKKSQWPHEKERAVFAEQLFKKALDTFEEGIKTAESKVEEGFHTEQDLRLVKDMREKCDYWKKKLYEAVSGKTGSCCS